MHAIKQQQARLSRSNFNLGGGPNHYSSTNQQEHNSKTISDGNDKSFRLQMLQKMQQTNFVHKTGFEKHISERSTLGPVPHKGEAESRITGGN